MEYFAFGETFLEEHSNTESTPYLFNGKELDEETGLYYYGARYYDPKTSVWQSVDPLAEKTLEPYIYCGNNPVVFIDPTGAFKIPIHTRITENAFRKSGLNKGWLGLFKLDVMAGVSVEADILGGFSDYHFDGRKNYSEVQSSWKGLNSEISNKIKELGSLNRAIGGDDVIVFGRMTHTVQDFYSHSNYVELYIDYYKSINKGAMPTSVPIYDDGIKNKDFILS